jgi:UDP-glucose 4-epimerase
MNILITGVNGLIGKAIASELVVDHKIIGISKSIDNKTNLKIEYHSIDISNAESVENLCKFKIDIIVHCAASLDLNPLSSDLISSNCMGIRNITNLAIKLNCKQFIYLSGISIIGRPLKIPITEDHPLNPNKIYHLTKYFGEEYLKLLLDKIKLVTLRISSPIGKDLAEDKIISTFIRQSMNNEDITLKGSGGRVQNYINVKDIAKSVNSVIQYEISGVYNISSGISYSNREIAEKCIKLFNSKSNIVYSGFDFEENDIWIISNDKAMQDFFFTSKYSIEDSLLEISVRYLK